MSDVSAAHLTPPDLRAEFEASGDPSYAMCWLGAKLRGIHAETPLAFAFSLALLASFLRPVADALLNDGFDMGFANLAALLMFSVVENYLPIAGLVLLSQVAPLRRLARVAVAGAIAIIAMLGIASSGLNIGLLVTRWSESYAEPDQVLLYIGASTLVCVALLNWCWTIARRPQR